MINNKVVVIDISSYQRYYKLNFNKWADAGVDGVILKMGEGPVTIEIWNKLMKSYIPVKGLYGWNYPLWDGPTQIEFFSKEITDLNPNLWGLDIEHWWVDWAEYLEAIQGKRKWDQVRKLTPAQINKSGREVWNGIRAKHPKRYGLKYTGEWFIRSYCPQMNEWINDGPNWPAAHPENYKGVRRVAWVNAKPPEPYSPIFDKNDPNEVKAWQGFQMNAWDLWQFTSTMIIPEEDYALDISIGNMTLDELKVKCGMVAAPPVPVVVDDKERLLRLWNKHPELHNL